MKEGNGKALRRKGSDSQIENFGTRCEWEAIWEICWWKLSQLYRRISFAKKYPASVVRSRGGKKSIERPQMARWRGINLFLREQDIEKRGERNDSLVELHKSFGFHRHSRFTHSRVTYCLPAVRMARLHKKAICSIRRQPVNAFAGSLLSYLAGSIYYFINKQRSGCILIKLLSLGNFSAIWWAFSLSR